MSTKNDQGNTNEIVQFEELDLDNDDDKGPSKPEQLALLLKEKLSAEDFSVAAGLLGLDSSEDLSNADLLEKLVELFQGKKPEEEEPEKKKPEDEEEDLMADYKSFIKECTDGGKTLEECAADWKKKYPDAPKEKEAELEKAGLEKDGKFTKMETRIKELEELNRVAEITTEVTELVQEKHLSPRQKPMVIKLSAAMDPELREGFLGLFKTQTFAVSEDKSVTTQRRPGSTSYEIDDETRARIMKEHGLASLIDDKGVMPLNN